MKKRITIGIDEVGRGALAGPVVLCAVAYKGRVNLTHPRLGRIRDSKKLTARRREAWFDYLTSHPKVRWRITRVSHRVVDRVNVARAANRGALRLAKRSWPPSKSAFIYLDGGLTLPEYMMHETVVKGDEKIPVVAAASIIAKVSRDRMMVGLGRKFPQYGFDVHKGYGTKFHRKMLRKYGPAQVHRRSFLNVGVV